MRTHCKQGHEYTEENTRMRNTGARRCRACDNVYKLRAYRNNPQKKEDAIYVLSMA